MAAFIANVMKLHTTFGGDSLHQNQVSTWTHVFVRNIKLSQTLQPMNLQKIEHAITEAEVLHDTMKSLCERAKPIREEIYNAQDVFKPRRISAGLETYSIASKATIFNRVVLNC